MLRQSAMMAPEDRMALSFVVLWC